MPSNSCSLESDALGKGIAPLPFTNGFHGLSLICLGVIREKRFQLLINPIYYGFR